VKNLNAKDQNLFTQACITLTAMSGEQINGVTTVRYTRTFASGKYPLQNNGPNYMVASFRSVDALGWHGADNHVTQIWNLNYFSGSATTTADVVTILRIIHGSIMITSWGLMLPFGLLWARYARRIPNDMPKDMWFRVHMPNQYFFAGLVMVGVVIGYTQVTLTGNGQHFTTVFHGILGTIIWILMVFQVIGAYFRPHKEPGKPLTKMRLLFEIFHSWNGRIMALAAVVQIVEGTRVIGWFADFQGGTAPAVTYIYGSVVILVLIMIVILELLNCRWESEKKKKAEGEQLKPTT